MFEGLDYITIFLSFNFLLLSTFLLGIFFQFFSCSLLHFTANLLPKNGHRHSFLPTMQLNLLKFYPFVIFCNFYLYQFPTNVSYPYPPSSPDTNYCTYTAHITITYLHRYYLVFHNGTTNPHKRVHKYPGDQNHLCSIDHSDHPYTDSLDQAIFQSCH